MNTSNIYILSLMNPICEIYLSFRTEWSRYHQPFIYENIYHWFVSSSSLLFSPWKINLILPVFMSFHLFWRLKLQLHFRLHTYTEIWKASYTMKEKLIFQILKKTIICLDYLVEFFKDFLFKNWDQSTTSVTHSPSVFNIPK